MGVFLRLGLLLTLVVGLAACETAAGFVQDSENLGSAIARELDD